MRRFFLFLPALLTVACTHKAPQSIAPSSTGDSISSGLEPGDAYEQGPLAGCTDLRDEQSIVVYRALRTAYAYTLPDTSSEYEEMYTVAEGDCLFSWGAVSVSDYQEHFLLYEWRGTELYYDRRDFEQFVYEGTQNFFCDFLRSHHQLCFASEGGDVLTFFELNQDGHKLEIPEMAVSIQDPEHVFMLLDNYNQLSVLQDCDGVVRLSNPYIQILKEDMDFTTSSEMVYDQRLVSDGVISLFSDPDFMTEMLFIPSQNAIFYGGKFFHYVDLQHSLLDLDAFGLSGRVKVMRESHYDQVWISYYFSPEGQLVSVSDTSDNKYYVSRSLQRTDNEDPESSDITYQLSIQSDDAVTREVYQLHFDTHRPYAYESSEGGVLCHHDYKYDRQGTLNGADVQYFDHEDVLPKVSMKYQVVTTDDQGNWTLRMLSDAKVKRQIEYY